MCVCHSQNTTGFFKQRMCLALTLHNSRISRAAAPVSSGAHLLSVHNDEPVKVAATAAREIQYENCASKC